MKTKYLFVILKVFFVFLTIADLSILSANPISYTWMDRDRQQVIYLNPNLIAELPSSLVRKDKNPRIIANLDSKLKAAITKGALPKSHANNYSEVFEETSGGRKMTLPGDIFVEFDLSWSESKVKEWAILQNLSIVQKLTSTRNIYRIKTNPGIECLHLANRLLAQEGVKSAFPNWWRESSVR